MRNKNLAPYTEQGLAHGLWKIYHSNGKLYFTLNCINGEECGVMEIFNDTEELLSKRYYAR